MSASLSAANEQDFEEICHLYEHVIAKVSGGPQDLIWDRAIHPSDSEIHAAIAQGSLLVMREKEGPLLGAVVLDNKAANGYAQIPWEVQAQDDQVGIIHLLAIEPALQGRGLGMQMMQLIAGRAKSLGWKALRLDVLPNATNARRLYTKAGFKELGIYKLSYTDPRVSKFVMYELELGE